MSKQNGWPIKQLDDICDFRGGGTPSKAEESYWKGDIPWVSPKDMKFDIIFDSIDHISAEAVKESTTSLIPKGSILIVVRSGILARTIPVAITGRDVTINQDIKALCPNASIDAKYLFYFLKSRLEEMLGLASRGATVHRIMADQIRAMYISVPPLPEQQRIVGILDEAFAGIATAKANAEKNLRNARELFESQLDSIFTDRTNEWMEVALGDVCTFIGGSQPPKSVFEKHSSPDNIRLIQIRDYKGDKHLVHIPKSLAKRFCKSDDVMIGRYGPPLFQILRGLDGAYNVALMKAVPDESRLTRDFLFYFLKHSTILQYVIFHSSRTAGQTGVTKETLEPYPIALPKLKEQQAATEKIRLLEAETQRLESLYQQKLAAIDALKKSLLHQAFSGHIERAQSPAR